jgi:hypothetical protein
MIEIGSWAFSRTVALLAGLDTSHVNRRRLWLMHDGIALLRCALALDEGQAIDPTKASESIQVSRLRGQD